MNFKSIIWDWNGTLLDDVGIAIDSMNQLLTSRSLLPLTLSQYLDVFTFPVQDYYQKVGFDLEKEPFEVPALQFIEIYNRAVTNCALHKEVVPLLEHLEDLGCRQFILSAMEQQQLEKTVSDCGISHFFEDLYGLTDHYAFSKTENGKSLIRLKGLEPGQTLLVGDTIHDYEVAQAIGCDCLLVANGHQSKKRLLGSGAKVVDSLNELEFFRSVMN